MQPLKKLNSFPPFSFSYCLSRNTSFINLLLLWWIFKIKRISSFNLLLVDFNFFLCLIWIYCFVYMCFLGCFFTFMLSWNSFIFGNIHSFLFGVSWRIMLKITGCCCFFSFKDTKYEVDTTSIILSYLYYFGNANKELFRYC